MREEPEAGPWRAEWLTAVVETVTGSVVVHIDDVAWWHSRFGWADLLVWGILMPVHPGAGGSFPSAAVGRARPERAHQGSGRMSLAYHRGGRCRAQ